MLPYMSNAMGAIHAQQSAVTKISETPINQRSRRSRFSRCVRLFIQFGVGRLESAMRRFSIGHPAVTPRHRTIRRIIEKNPINFRLPSGARLPSSPDHFQKSGKFELQSVETCELSARLRACSSGYAPGAHASHPDRALSRRWLWIYHSALRFR